MCLQRKSQYENETISLMKNYDNEKLQDKKKWKRGMQGGFKLQPISLVSLLMSFNYYSETSLIGPPSESKKVALLMRWP